jgi:ABC-type proline/glycine betaine transport system ATPase subunit
MLKEIQTLMKVTKGELRIELETSDYTTLREEISYTAANHEIISEKKESDNICYIQHHLYPNQTVTIYINSDTENYLIGGGKPYF